MKIWVTARSKMAFSKKKKKMYIAPKNEGCLERNSISFRERELQTESTTCLKTIKQKII